MVTCKVFQTDVLSSDLLAHFYHSLQKQKARRRRRALVAPDLRLSGVSRVGCGNRDHIPKTEKAGDTLHPTHAR